MSLALRSCWRLLLGVCCIGFVAAAHNLSRCPPLGRFCKVI